MTTTLKDAQEKVRTLSFAALQVAEDGKTTAAEKRTKLDELEPDIKKWEDEVADLTKVEEQRKRFLGLSGTSIDSPDPAGDQGQNASAKSIGEQFVSSAKYKSLVEGGLKGNWTSGSVELKTLVSEGTTGSPGSGFGLVQTPNVLPGIVDIQLQPLVVSDLIPGGTTDSPLIRYLVETAITNAAAGTAEGALKPESAIAFGVVDEAVKKITTFLPVTDEMLEDFAQMASYLNARLLLFVNQNLQTQLLRGDGTNNTLVGLLNRPGLARTIDKGGDAAVVGPPALPAIPASDNDQDAIYRQITNLRVTSFLEPDGIVMTPTTWQTIVLTKSSQGLYYAGGPFAPTPNQIWGKRVVATPAMVENEALVGAFAQASQLFSKGGLTVEASNSHADFFQRNQTAIRAERRQALAVYRPGAFGIVTGL